MTDILEEKVHVWKGLKEYQPTPEEKEELTIYDSVFGIKAKIVAKLKVNESFIFSKIHRSDEGLYRRATIEFQKGIEKLNEAGFDVGRGNTKYGFKMPKPEKGEQKRELIIFRRY